jgi:hypothetical protein
MADPTPTSPQKLAELIEMISSFKKDFNSDNIIEEIKKRTSVFYTCIYGILTFIILLLLGEDANRDSFLSSFTKQTWHGWIWIGFIVIFSVILIYVTHELSRKVNNFKKSHQSLSENPKIIDSSIISRIDLLEGNINLNFKHSQKFFESIIKKYVRASDTTTDTPSEKSYEKFVMEFKNVNHDILPDALTIIPDEIQNSANGCFYCVISYEAFFKDDDQAKESIRYFASFYLGTAKNFVQRIFTVPGKGTPSTIYKMGFDTEEEKFKSKTLLKYLLVNKISSVETYLLVYDEKNTNDIQNKFFTLADYVIAMPSTCQSINQNKLFFAYPEASGGKDQVVVTTDSYLIQLMKKDFDYRINKLDKTNQSLNIVELRTSSYDDILKMLGFNLSNPEHLKIINREIENLSTTLNEMSQEHSFYDTKTINKLLTQFKKCQIRNHKKPQTS